MTCLSCLASPLCTSVQRAQVAASVPSWSLAGVGLLRVLALCNQRCQTWQGKVVDEKFVVPALPWLAVHWSREGEVRCCLLLCTCCLLVCSGGTAFAWANHCVLSALL